MIRLSLWFVLRAFLGFIKIAHKSLLLISEASHIFVTVVLVKLIDGFCILAHRNLFAAFRFFFYWVLTCTLIPINQASASKIFDILNSTNIGLKYSPKYYEYAELGVMKTYGPLHGFQGNFTTSYYNFYLDGIINVHKTNNAVYDGRLYYIDGRGLTEKPYKTNGAGILLANIDFKAGYIFDVSERLQLIPYFGGGARRFNFT